jgi:phosphocarrier protein
MLSKKVVIVNDMGFHARPAARIAAIAREARGGEVRILNNGLSADASSVIDMLMLACQKGSTITVEIDSETDLDVLNRIVNLVESGFGE